jgi:hypothetical protein
MTDPATLLALADRVEALTGPDRALDWETHCRNGLDGVGGYGDHPAYTASLDAALSLVTGQSEYPDHKTFLIDCATQTSQFSQPVAWVWNDAGKHMGKAPTPAAALTAASLRALARDTEGQHIKGGAG